MDSRKKWIRPIGAQHLDHVAHARTLRFLPITHHVGHVHVCLRRQDVYMRALALATKT